MMDHVSEARKQNEFTSSQLAMETLRLPIHIGDPIVRSSYN